MNKEELIEYLESKDWCVWSCGRSTDYCEELDLDLSINKLKEFIK